MSELVHFSDGRSVGDYRPLPLLVSINVLSMLCTVFFLEFHICSSIDIRLDFG